MTATFTMIVPALQSMPRGPVAQGIEQQPSKLKVAGSNPAGVASSFLVQPGDMGNGMYLTHGDHPWQAAEKVLWRGRVSNGSGARRVKHALFPPEHG